MKKLSYLFLSTGLIIITILSLSSITKAAIIEYELQLTPDEVTNNLSEVNSHSVTATLTPLDGMPVDGVPIIFTVTGQNAGAEGTCNTGENCLTDANGEVTFTYTVPQKPGSLGTDIIEATASVFHGGITPTAPIGPSDSAIKHWVDTTPPTSYCLESVNPSGQTTPPAGSTTLPGPKGGQNEDGFYQLSASDAVWGDELDVYVVDTGSGTVFGPFAVGTVIKYTEDSDAIPEYKAIGSSKGKAGAVYAHIFGNGDASVKAVDGSGNVGSEVLCLVPEPPK